MRLYRYIFFFLAFPFVSNGQSVGDTLDIEEAVAMALENNSDLVVAKNEAEIAGNNNTIGNAGLLPSLRANAGYTRSIQDVNITFAGTGNTGEGQPPINRQNAVSETYSASISLDYNIFNGFRKYNLYNTLQLREELSGIQSRMTAENVIAQTTNLYLQASRLAAQLEIDKQAIILSRERLTRLEARYEFGKSTKLQILNAKVDLDNDSVAYLNTRVELENQKRQLLSYLGTDTIYDDYHVATRFMIIRDLSFDEIYVQAIKNNTSVLIAKLQQENAGYQVDINQAALWPSLDASVSYVYNKQQNEAGFIESQRSKGFQGGLNISYNIFDGFTRFNDIENAKIQLETSEERRQEALRTLKTQVKNTFNTYSNNLKLLNFALDNYETALINFERSEESYFTGQITSTELRQAQLNLISAQNRIINYQIAVKRAEINLYQLAGWLL